MALSSGKFAVEPLWKLLPFFKKNPRVKQIHFTLAVWWVARDQILFNHNGFIKGLRNRWENGKACSTDDSKIKR